MQQHQSPRRRFPIIGRDEIRSLAACPKCGAQRGGQCVGVRGKLRESNHAERVNVAKRVAA